VGGAAGTGLGLAGAPSRAVVTGDRCSRLNGPRLHRVCRLQVARVRLSDYAELEVCWHQGLTAGLLCTEAKSCLVVVGAKVDSVPS